jgi:hypothetical protein
MASTAIAIALKVEPWNKMRLNPKGDGEPLGRGSV